MNQIVFNMISAIDDNLKSATLKLTSLQNCELDAIEQDIKSANLKLAVLEGYLQAYSDVEAAQQSAKSTTPPIEKAEQTTPKLLSEENSREIKGSYIVPGTKNSKWGVLLFTEKEIKRMPNKFRKDFRVGRIVAHVRKKDNGVYEVQCQINHQKIYASSKFLDVAKEKFTDKLVEYAANVAIIRQTEKRVVAEKLTQPPVTAPMEPEKPKPVTLREYMLKWLKMVKKPTVKENTYNLYYVYYRVNICPFLGDKPIAEIKPFDVQNCINNLVENGKIITAKQCRILLNAVFEYAVIDDVILKSPMAKVVVPHTESKEGVPLSREEEKTVVELMLKKSNIHVQACVFMLYTGLRRSELASIQIRDGWVHVISAKGRKGHKVKLRSIPVSPMLAPLLPYMNIEGIKTVKARSLSTMAKNIIPNHHIHELRHTFITRCRECGIRREIVSLWAGHAADSSITSTVYTHLQTNKDIQLDEIKKFKYDLDF